MSLIKRYSFLKKFISFENGKIKENFGVPATSALFSFNICILKQDFLETSCFFNWEVAMNFIKIIVTSPEAWSEKYTQTFSSKINVRISGQT